MNWMWQRNTTQIYEFCISDPRTNRKQMKSLELRAHFSGSFQLNWCAVLCSFFRHLLTISPNHLVSLSVADILHSCAIHIEYICDPITSHNDNIREIRFDNIWQRATKSMLRHTAFASKHFATYLRPEKQMENKSKVKITHREIKWNETV